MSKKVPGQKLPRFFPGSAKKVCQLTGDYDAHLKKKTISRTKERFGVPGTDLGNSFEHKGRLYFAFGDTLYPGWRWDRDPLAYTTSTDPAKIKLEFLTHEDGLFLPITIPGISQLAFEVPTGGLSVGGSMYINFVSGHSRTRTMGYSVLAVSEDDGYTFELVYELSRNKLIDVHMIEVGSEEVEGLPGKGNNILLWGAGTYRRGNPYLAVVPSEKLRNKSSIKYFAGTTAQGRPVWVESEDKAVPLFEHPHIGEFSVTWCSPLKRWIMLYNSSYADRRGIIFRSSVHPWGPWSRGELIFSEFDSGGYGTFMNCPDLEDLKGTKLSHPENREQTWGHIYGPYITKRYIKGNSKRCTIYFTMSIWNPYQVVIMQADIGFPDRPGLSTVTPNESPVIPKYGRSDKDCILIWGKENKLLFANQAAMDFAEVTDERLKDIISREISVPDIWRLWNRRVELVFRSKKSMKAEDQIPIIERLIYIKATLSPVFDIEENVIAVAIVFRDISQQEELVGSVVED